MGIFFQIVFLALTLGSLLPKPTPSPATPINTTSSQNPQTIETHPAIITSPSGIPSPTTSSSAVSTLGKLPNGGGGEITVGYASPKGSSPYYPAFSPPNVKATLSYSKTGYSTTSTDSPSHSFKGLPPGKYTISLSSLPSAYTVSHIVAVYQNGAWSKQSEENGTSASLNLLGNGYEQGSVSFIFTPSNETDNASNPSDSEPPKVTNVEAPSNIWDANTDHVISKKDFCITIHTSDNTSSENDIQDKVILHNLDNNFQLLYDTGWSAGKVSCFNSLVNGSYQLEINLRDKAGNIANYATQFRILSS